MESINILGPLSVPEFNILIEDPAIFPPNMKVQEQLESDTLESDNEKESFLFSRYASSSIDELDIEDAQKWCYWAIQKNYENLDAHLNLVRCQSSPVIREAEMRELISVFRPIYKQWITQNDRNNYIRVAPYIRLLFYFGLNQIELFNIDEAITAFEDIVRIRKGEPSVENGLLLLYLKKIGDERNSTDSSCLRTWNHVDALIESRKKKTSGYAHYEMGKNSEAILYT